MAKQKSYSLEEALKILAPIKARLEEKYNSGNKWTQNAVKRDLDLVNAKIMALQQQNESQKQPDNSMQFAKGGYLPKYENSGFTPDDYYQFMPQGKQNPFTGTFEIIPPKQEESIQKGFNFPTYVEQMQTPSTSNIPQSPVETNNKIQEKKAPWYAGKDWGNYGAIASQLLPIGYNLVQGFSKPDKYKQNQNPFNKESTQLVRDSINRDITESLRENQRQATGLGEIAKTASQGNGGNYMAMMNQIAKNKQSSDFSLNEWKQNTEAAAKAQAANQLLGIGQGITNEQNRVQMLDSQAKAAQQAYLQQGLGDLSKFGQLQQQMNNTKQRDLALVDMMNKTYPALMGYFNVEEGAKLGKSMTYEERKEMDKLQAEVAAGTAGASERAKAFAYSLKQKYK